MLERSDSDRDAGEAGEAAYLRALREVTPKGGTASCTVVASGIPLGRGHVQSMRGRFMTPFEM